MLRKLLPREDQYFDLFVQMTNYIVEAVRELRDMLNDKQPNCGRQNRAEIVLITDECESCP